VSLLETRSLDDISVEAVAEHVGVSPGLLFHYFGGQRTFRRAVIQTAARELLEQMRPDPGLSPAVQLHEALDTFTANVERHPGLYLAVVRYNGDLSGVRWNVRAVLAEWLVTGLTQAGVPITPAVRMTISGWLAFSEQALLSWIADASPTPAGPRPPRMTRTELVVLCERACYRLLELAVADPARWPDIERTITRPPSR
jgi:AcrR family transcriptional regulator